MQQSLKIEVAEGGFNCYVAWPETAGSHPVIVVLQEIFGVNAGIRQIAQAYAAQGYIAVAPDLFWREAPGLELSDARQEDWQRGFALYTGYDLEKGVADIQATIGAARSLANSNGKVGVTGYCLGGLLTYLSAARTDADAFAAYYGGATEQYLDRAALIKAPLIYHLAEADEYIDHASQQQIKKALQSLPESEIYSYPERDHAFARPDGQHYHAADAALANARTAAFFERHLKAG